MHWNNRKCIGAGSYVSSLCILVLDFSSPEFFSSITKHLAGINFMYT